MTDKTVPAPPPRSLVAKADWFSDPNAVVAQYFAAGGPLSAVIDGYKPSDVQRRFSQAVAESVLFGVDDPGRVRFLEADTGVGKTHGYLAPALLHCVLTEQRMVVSTYTNELKAQAGWQDGPAACDAVERMTGIRPTIALYLPYAEFASPERCRALADRLQNENPKDPASAAAAQALTSLAGWTDVETHFAKASMRPQVEVVAAFRGIVSTWQQEYPDMADDLPKELTDLWCVDVKCCPDDLLVRSLYATAAETATCIVCTHALLLIDLKLGGRILRGRDKPFAVTVVDEAHRMDDAARSVLGVRVSLSSLEHSIMLAASAVREDGKSVPDERRKRLGEAIMSYQELFTDLTRVSRELQEQAGRRRTSRIAVMGDEPWIETFSLVASAAKDLAQQLDELGTPHCLSTSRSLEMRAESMKEFVKASRDDKRKNGRTYVSFSPMRSEPSVLVEAKFGSRITQRLWNTYKGNGETREPSSKATVFTSATLAQPGATRGAQAFRAMEQMLGLDITPDVLLPGETFAPAFFGRMTFAFPSPFAPDPDYYGDADAEARYNRYVAETIALAASERIGPDGRANVLVLTKSFAETLAVGELLARGPLADRVMARTRNVSLGRAKKWFASKPDAILVTPGAWEGINLPHLIDHLVHARLPFVPPEDGFGAPIVYRDVDHGIVASEDVASMMRRFRQGIGRGLRHADDKVKLWILDRRFGLPDVVETRHNLFGSKKGKLYHSCLPRRFSANRDAGEVIPCPAPMAPVAPRPARRNANP